jgi:hypothetical protein
LIHKYFSADEYNDDNIKVYFENLKKMIKNIQGRFNDDQNKISKNIEKSLNNNLIKLIITIEIKYLDCLVFDKQNLEDEIKYFKSKVENMHKKNIQSNPNLHIYLRQQYEEELDYYKHKNLELEKVKVFVRIKLETARAKI